MSRSWAVRPCVAVTALLAVLAVAAGAAGRPRVGTLAIVVTECGFGPAGVFAAQRLEVRRGDRSPSVVMEASGVPEPDFGGLCDVYGQYRLGFSSLPAGVFQRLGVSPDGRRVVFEVTDDHAYEPWNPSGPPVTPPVEGMFVVNADGSGVRRIGPASRHPAFTVRPLFIPPYVNIAGDRGFHFSPDGRTILFSDLGPGDDGLDAAQLVTLDLMSGRRTQVTQFRKSSQEHPRIDVPVAGVFVDDRRLLIRQEVVNDATSSFPIGYGWYTARRDGSGLREVSTSVVLPGGRLVPTFQVTGASGALFTVLGEPAAEPVPDASPVRELFLFDKPNLLQLTNFGRGDTETAFVGRGGRRMFFKASADPLGRNPSGTCQLFSVDRFGRMMRQLTHFESGVPGASSGCFGSAPPDCTVGFELTTQDRATGTVVFDATCDPFGANPAGQQVFAMRPDGSALRQLTAYRGRRVAPDGTVTVELPGPIAYPGFDGLH